MINKKYNVIVSQRATEMLVSHVRFLAQVSNNAAKKLKDEIVKEIDKLDTMPESYPGFYCEGIPINKYRKK